MMIDQVQQKLKLCRYSNSTISVYTSCLRDFALYFEGHRLELLTTEDINLYLLTLVDKNYARSTQNQHINAIKFYYEKVLHCERKHYQLDRPRKEYKLPIVLSKSEVTAIFNSVANLKHRAILALLYSAGLRIGEVLSLEINHINSKQMQLHVVGGKGAKDRNVPLDENVLVLLRKYYASYKPKRFLFNGQNSMRYSETSIRKFIKRASRSARINKNIPPHTFRHSYATHLLESGTDLRYTFLSGRQVQVLLGHKNVKTTEIYTHVRSIKLNEIKSPFHELSLTW